jgi:hypothetical protein
MTRRKNKMAYRRNTGKGSYGGKGGLSRGGYTPTSSPGMSYSMSLSAPGLSYSCSVTTAGGYVQIQNNLTVGPGYGGTPQMNASAPYSAGKDLTSRLGNAGVNSYGVNKAPAANAAKGTYNASTTSSVADKLDGISKAYGATKPAKNQGRYPLAKGKLPIAGYTSADQKESAGKAYGTTSPKYTDGASALDDYPYLFNANAFMNQKNQEQMDKYEKVAEDDEAAKKEPKVKDKTRKCGKCGYNDAIDGNLCEVCLTGNRPYLLRR